jgi:hypothetical protein
LPAGTKIFNKAYIYFDYNSPIETNTVMSFFHDGPPTGITDMYKKDMLLFPNPSSGFISVNYKPLSANCYFEILDVTVRKVSSIRYEVLREEQLINISHLPQGVYMLKVRDGDLIFSQRFIRN